MESAQQVTGGTNRCQCQTGEGFFFQRMRYRNVCVKTGSVRSSCWRSSRKMGYSPIQSIATGLCERSRKGIMESLRNFITVDNHCALDVGHLSEGTRLFPVRRPKFTELTLRAEDFGSQKSSVNVNHIVEDRWRPPLVDVDWACPLPNNLQRN